ncbi:hypothetical protein ACVGVM_21900 [Pseudonocardia bannensis]|uniref:ATP synthase protein I n=1 Tax=Pseudonocardia bannensis TaxID=630973 RepID=A0A848DHW0_9PSEU|nr:hypothetical protein [Pseudonocardia bannensis]NMH92135.1 hypothetical protein [Pseudonocardia bannensis]
MSTDDASPPATDPPHVATVLRLAGAMQRTALILGVATSAVAIVVAVVLRGGPGLVGAVIGAVLALLAGAVGTFVMRGTARTSPAGVMIGAMTAFAGKIVILLIFLLIFRGTTLFDNQTFAFTLLAVTAAWIVGEVVGFVRAKVPAVDL